MSRQEPDPARSLMKAHRLPKEGTKLRQVYDALKAAPGQPVMLDFIEDRSLLGRQVNQLRDFYGLDIQHCQLEKGSRRNGVRCHHVLVGEHTGKDYVSYLDASA